MRNHKIWQWMNQQFELLECRHFHFDTYICVFYIDKRNRPLGRTLEINVNDTIYGCGTYTCVLLVACFAFMYRLTLRLMHTLGEVATHTQP